MKFIATFLLALVPLVAGTQYHLTPNFYPSSANHQNICKRLYGDHSDVLDFSELKKMVDVKIKVVMDELGIPVTVNENHFFITYDHQQHYSGSSRISYFFEMHNAPAPAFFDKIDHHAGLNVGVTNKMGRIVCTSDDVYERNRRLQEVEEEAKEEEAPTMTRRLRSSWKGSWSSWW